MKCFACEGPLELATIGSASGAPTVALGAFDPTTNCVPMDKSELTTISAPKPTPEPSYPTHRGELTTLVKQIRKAETLTEAVDLAGVALSKRPTPEPTPALELIAKWRHLAMNAIGYRVTEGYEDAETTLERCAEELEKALAVSVSSDSTPAWQPIETAPKDKLVLLWWRAEHGRDVVSYWATGEWKDYGDGSRGWIGESFYVSEPNYWTRLLGEKPTHWMPLPSSPPDGDN